MYDSIVTALWIVVWSIYVLFSEGVSRNLNRCRKLNDDSLKNLKK
jgi:hypothetical protein